MRTEPGNPARTNHHSQAPGTNISRRSQFRICQRLDEFSVFARFKTGSPFEQTPEKETILVTHLVKSFNTVPHTSPHGHYVTEDGKYVLTPNAPASSVSVIDTQSGDVTEIPTGAVIPIAIWGDPQGNTGYAANFLGTSPSMLASLSVIDINRKKKLEDIDIAADYDPVSGKITGKAYGLLPIQTPVSPDGRYVVTANTLSMSITIVDTATNKVVKSLPYYIVIAWAVLGIVGMFRKWRGREIADLLG